MDKLFNLFELQCFQLSNTFLHNMCMCMLSGGQLFVTPWTVAYQAPLSWDFSRQEYWSGLPFPSPGDLPDPGIEPASLMSPALAGGFFTTESPGKPILYSKNKISPCISIGLVAKLCPTLCDPMDRSPPASSVHGIFQARILEWVALSSSRRYS